MPFPKVNGHHQMKDYWMISQLSSVQKVATGDPTWKKEEKAIATREEEAKRKNNKQRVPWEEDGSMEILMDWIMTHGNQATYGGANGNKGRSKSQHYKDLTLLIKSKKLDSNRREKDMENKIISLERQFREASDLANNTGAGVENPGDFEAAVLKRCPYYKQLEEIIQDQPNSKPLATKEEEGHCVLSDSFDASAVQEDENPNQNSWKDSSSGSTTNLKSMKTSSSSK